MTRKIIEIKVESVTFVQSVDGNDDSRMTAGPRDVNLSVMSSLSGLSHHWDARRLINRVIPRMPFEAC